MNSFLDRWDVPVQAASEPAVRRLDQAVEDLVSLAGDPVERSEEAVRADPSLALGRIYRAYLELYSTTPEGTDRARAWLEPLAGAPDELAPREGAHLRAAGAWAAGDLDGTAEALEGALRRHPRDLLALKLAQDVYFFSGRRQDLRDVVTRVLPAWPAGSSGAGYVRGMLAFGLEENDRFDPADRLAAEALAVNPADVWAVHAGAHVLEMQGRQEQGIAFLRRTAPDWEKSYFAVHNWWHLGLYLVELGRTDDALDLYDRKVRARRDDLWLDLVDAGSLLWRLHLTGTDLGDRPRDLAEDLRPHTGEATYLFNDLHLVMVAGLAGQDDLAATTIRAAGDKAVGTNRWVAGHVGLNLLSAVRAFAAGEFGRAAAGLWAARPRAVAIGGSNAQRDVVDLTLLAAASAAGESGLTSALVAERDHRKPAAADATARLVEVWSRAGPKVTPVGG